jgi:hypothetical protein
LERQSGPPPLREALHGRFSGLLISIAMPGFLTT